MRVYPPGIPLFVSAISSRYSGASAGRAYVQGVGAFSSGAWPSANRALYVPMVIPWPYPVKRAWWVNGATVTGNVDVGIYDARRGTKLFSTGATAQSGASASQYVTVDWLVQPGEYYFACSMSNTSTLFRTNGFSTNLMRLCGMTQEASAHPLPSSMTPVVLSAAYWPLFGITRTPSGY